MKKVLISLLLFIPIFLNAQTKAKPKAKAATQTAATTASITRGQLVYAQYCLSCHQVDGAGVQGMNPPLVKTSYIKGDKAKLIKVVLNGFLQPADIDGESYSNTMPPHNFLKDQEIADVLTFIRNNFTNKGTAITATQVKAARASLKK